MVNELSRTQSIVPTNFYDRAWPNDRGWVGG
jgi:hypothetical protein